MGPGPGLRPVPGAVPAGAAQDKAPAKGPAGKTTAQTAPSKDAPSLEMLDFLGGFTTPDGRFVDPEDLEVMPPAKEQDNGKN
jgi:hypothetical protein